MFQSKLPTTGNSIFSEMSALAKAHQAINLSQGFPDFKINDALIAALNEAIAQNDVQYAPMPGRMDLRLAISRKMELRHEIRVDPVDEITITAGATQAIYTVFAATINPGDEVIVFDPAYDCYDPSIRVHGGIPIHINLNYPDFTIDWKLVEEHITEQTKMIVINNPHNPSGSVLTPSDVLALEKLVAQFPNLMVLSDEVYEHIQYEGVHQSILKNKYLRERSFVVYSFGKSMHVTGWKLGYCIAPAHFMVEFRKIHQYMVFCANNTMQSAVAKFLTVEDWKNVHQLYTRKKELFLTAIQSSRLRPLKCEGTYFCLLDYREVSDLEDITFAKKMTKEYGVAVVPISVFYADKTDHKLVRVCFAKEDITLLKAAKLLCKI
jgi:methionine aminotransferase